MVASMKQRGMTEVRSLLSRLRRLHALGRVGNEDFRFMESRLQEVEARIIAMHEQGEEEF